MAQARLTWRGLLGLLTFFAILCSLFGLIVTLAEGWREYRQTQWPETTARIRSCSVEESPCADGSRASITCRIGYHVNDEAVAATVRSRSVMASPIWQFLADSIGVGDMQEWVDRHPEGTPISVRYNPTRYGDAALLATDMPLGGPRTPANLKLLAFVVAACVVLLTITRVTRAAPT
jgi:hypothetical protein